MAINHTTSRPGKQSLVRCFFNDLCRLNGDTSRGESSKKYLERGRSHDLLVASFVASYDVSRKNEKVDNENQDDGTGPDKEMGEGGGGVRVLNNVMVLVIVWGRKGGMEMTTVWRTMRTRTRFGRRTTGGDRRRRRRRSNMLMSLISCIVSTGE
jgi:hypothetical protein